MREEEQRAVDELEQARKANEAAHDAFMRAQRSYQRTQDDHRDARRRWMDTLMRGDVVIYQNEAMVIVDIMVGPTTAEEYAQLRGRELKQGERVFKLDGQRAESVGVDPWTDFIEPATGEALERHETNRILAAASRVIGGTIDPEKKRELAQRLRDAGVC